MTSLQTIRKNFQKSIKILSEYSTLLSSEFGKSTSNPLLKGQSIGPIAKRFIDNQMVKAFEFWASENTNYSTAIFRATLVYISDMMADAMDSTNSTASDVNIARKIRKLLSRMTATLDNMKSGVVTQ